MDKGINSTIRVTSLGQTGFKFIFDRLVVYIDPYLTDSVAETEGESLRRMIPPIAKPDQIRDADFILISHIHKDHCDPDTLLPMQRASEKSTIICPNEVAAFLKNIGINSERIMVANRDWISLDKVTRLLPLPAAHPEIQKDGENFYRCMSYVIEYRGKRIYHAGDTSPHDELIDALKKMGHVDVAFLPVNERNYYREKNGIIGNMSVREAFQMATEIGVKTLVPTHWDLFAPNSVYQDEIELLYRHLKPSFRLLFNPSAI